MLRIRKISLFDLMYILIGVPCLFMMLVTSRGFTHIKTILLATTALIALLEILSNRIKYPVQYIIYIILFIGYFILSLAIGMFNGFEFSFETDFSLIQYYIITPAIIVIVYGAFIDRPDRINILIRILGIITLFIVVMDVWKLLYYQGILPNIDFFELIMVASSNTLADHLALRVSNEYVLMYLLPFHIVLFSVQNTSYKYKAFYLAIIVFGMIYSLLSGRKILEIVVFGSALFMVIYQLILKRQFKMLGGVLVILILAIMLGKNVSEMLGLDNLFLTAQRTIQRGLSFQSSGMIIRMTDAKALLNMWYRSPIWGWGLNSYAREAIANSITKWSYEIVYVALLAQTGIIGVGLFFASVWHICKRTYISFTASNNCYYFAALIAFVSFIICGATNPLVYVPWPWILTLAIANQYKEDGI